MVKEKKTNTVYVLVYDNGHNEFIEAVFSSREKAKNKAKKDNWDYFYIEEKEVQ